MSHPPPSTPGPSSPAAPVTQAAAATSAKPVPLFELATQWQAIRNEVEAAVKEVLDSQNYVSGAVSGPFVGRFEENLGKHLGSGGAAAHVTAVSSGTDAILAALMAMGIGHGDEVITTPFTFFATAGCIARVGARTVFADIDPETFLLDEAKVAAAITTKTKAVVPVHLFGQIGDTHKLKSAAKGVRIIEDACQAIGARDQHGMQVAENADCACLSFYPTKNLGAAGDAGAVVTRDEKLGARFRQTRQHGEVSRYHHEFVGGNFRMDAIQAAVLNVKLNYLDRWNKQRQAIAAYYTARFAGSAVKPPRVLPGARHVFHQYVIRAPRRDSLRDHLAKNGVGCNIYYPKPLHAQACFADLGYKKGAFPLSEQAADEVLALPIFPELGEGQLARVADTVLGFYK